MPHPGESHHYDVGLPMTAPIRDELLEPLRRCARWLFSLRDGAGRIVCPEHGIEHTGKSGCAAILAARLAAHDPRAGAPGGTDWGALAVEQGRRLVARLTREGTSPCHTFHPGRHDPYNNSNHVIDGGSCSDALAELVTTLGERLSADDREAFRAASLLHARTYLRYAVLDKGIPAQRAWGLTGLAGAFALEADPELERAGIEAVGGLEAIQNADGSFPYHPLEWGAEHVGASDGSAFYQSRVSAFTLHALARLGRDPRADTFVGPLARGLDFVSALQGPDGIKVGLLEAKPWYWGAHYEVASHPFDVFLLARGGEVLGRPAHGLGALRAFRSWAAHLVAGGADDGRPRSHLDGPGRRPSYQCPLFWAAHACWHARALPELERASAREAPPAAGERVEAPGRGRSISARVAHFPDVDLVRLEDDAVVAWVRGRRPGYNLHHGSPHGAGLLRAVRKRDGAELVRRARLAADQEGEWSGRAGHFRAGRGWRQGAGELRFSAWLARHQHRTKRPGGPLAPPLRVLREGIAAFGSSRVSSAFPLDAELELRDDGVLCRASLAWAGGAPVPGAVTERLFQLAGEGLHVRDRATPGAARDLGHRMPEGAGELERGAERGARFVAYRLG